MRINKPNNQGQGLIEVLGATVMFGVLITCFLRLGSSGNTLTNMAQNKSDLENLRQYIRSQVSCEETIRNQQTKCDEGNPISMLSKHGSTLAGEAAGETVMYGFGLTASCVRNGSKNQITISVVTPITDQGLRADGVSSRPLFSVPLLCPVVSPKCPTETSQFTGILRQKSFLAETMDAMPAPYCGGLLYVVGHFNWYDSMSTAPVNHIVRLLPDGSLDTEFNTGTAFTNGGPYQLAPALDGTTDIYAVGPFTEWQGSATNHVIRIRADGTKDPAFSAGLGFDLSPNAIATDTTLPGKVYVGGRFSRYFGNSFPVNIRSIVRLNRDGTLDNTFNQNLSFLGGAEIQSILPITSGPHVGQVYVGGSFTVQFSGVDYQNLIRLNPDGTLDASFRADSIGNVSSLIIPGNSGTEVLVGSDSPSAPLVKLTETGAREPSFFVNTLNARVTNVKPSPSDDKIYVSGEFYWIKNAQIYGAGIARLNQDGSIDPTFDLNGSGISGSTRVLAPLKNGLIYVGGTDHLTLNGDPTTRGLMALTTSGSYALTIFVQWIMPLFDAIQWMVV